MPQRGRAHKGNFGRALIIAGSRQYTGAAKLSLRLPAQRRWLVFAAIPNSTLRWQASPNPFG